MLSSVRPLNNKTERIVGDMKTSNEIKAFIIERLEARDPMELYFEMFRQMEEDKYNLQHLKAVMSRWRCACREASQEKGWGGLDETFPRSIFCWNATLNAIDKQKEKQFYRSLKDAFGWDVEAIAKGEHCPIAQIIIDTMQQYFINKQKERLGLNVKQEED